MRYLKERRTSSVAPTGAPATPSRCSAGARVLQEPARGQRRSRILDDDGVRANSDRAHTRQGHRPRIVPIVPDEARTFGMEGMFRQVGIYSSMGQLYTPQDSDQLSYYRERQEGPDPRGRHQRGRGVLLVDRGSHVVRESRRADDSFLYLLLDVRLPAHRRFRVGRRRHARARLPARRHGRPHDACRRRACSIRTGTASSSPRRFRIAARTTRASTTSSRSSSRTACGACAPSRRASSITSP